MNASTVFPPHRPCYLKRLSAKAESTDVSVLLWAYLFSRNVTYTIIIFHIMVV